MAINITLFQDSWEHDLHWRDGQEHTEGVQENTHRNVSTF